MAYKWLKALETEYPDIAERAKRLNKMDGFKMYVGGVEWRHCVKTSVVFY